MENQIGCRRLAAIRLALNAAASDDVQLFERRLGDDTLIAEAAEIEGAEAAIDDELAEGPSGSWRLLHAVTAETVDQIQIIETGMTSDDSVLVERVVIVVTGPGTLDLELREGRYAVGEGRPDHLVEHRI